VIRSDLKRFAGLAASVPLPTLVAPDRRLNRTLASMRYSPREIKVERLRARLSGRSQNPSNGSNRLCLASSVTGKVADVGAASGQITFGAIRVRGRTINIGRATPAGGRSGSGNGQYATLPLLPSKAPSHEARLKSNATALSAPVPTKPRPSTGRGSMEDE